MTYYDLKNPLHIEQVKIRLETLVKKGVTIELTEKKVKRTLQQNAYLHLILGYFASQVGEKLDVVKRRYYKIHCNRDLYVREEEDKLLHQHIKFVRSSTELTKDEMQLSIERFRNWSSSEIGIYIPNSDEHEYILQIQADVERYKTFI